MPGDTLDASDSEERLRQLELEDDFRIGPSVGPIQGSNGWSCRLFREAGSCTTLLAGKAG